MLARSDVGRWTSAFVQDRPLHPAVHLWAPGLGMWACMGVLRMCLWLYCVTVWVHLVPCVLVTVAHDVLCNAEACELAYPAGHVELCVFVFVSLIG